MLQTQTIHRNTSDESQESAVPKLYSMTEAAKILHCSRTTLNNLRHSGDLQTTRIKGTRRRLITQAELNRLIEEGFNLGEAPDYETCEANTESGSRCLGRPKADSFFCGQHSED
tara:strand:- start:3043 stop:3384 length:342 start_codon:yes stop_codon:yes gene_type:complete